MKLRRRVGVEPSEVNRSERYIELVLVEGDLNVLSDESIRDVDAAAVDVDSASAINASFKPEHGCLETDEWSRISPRRRHIDRDGRLHPERLVRTLLVVRDAKFVERAPLGAIR